MFLSLVAVAGKGFTMVVSDLCRLESPPSCRSTFSNLIASGWGRRIGGGCARGWHSRLIRLWSARHPSARSSGKLCAAVQDIEAREPRLAQCESSWGACSVSSRSLRHRLPRKPRKRAVAVSGSSEGRGGRGGGGTVGGGRGGDVGGSGGEPRGEGEGVGGGAGSRKSGHGDGGTAHGASLSDTAGDASLPRTRGKSWRRSSWTHSTCRSSNDHGRDTMIALDL